MSERIYNFTPGPAMLPLPVLHRIREELYDYQGLGASVMEISHLAPEFRQLLDETMEGLRGLLGFGKEYKIVFAHGGGNMQFSMVPMNLIARAPARKALYANTGHFSERAIEDARRFGQVEVVTSSEESGHDHIPAIDPARLDQAASYLHITTNNTIMGTRYADFPDTGALPLVGDMTSEILSRRIPVGRFGLIYAGLQKNLGPSGVSVAIVREDLLHHALPETPSVLNYTRLARDRSLTNTINTFSIYVMKLMLDWVRDGGGVEAMERQNDEKAATVYAAMDRHAGFYKGHARPEARSTMNVTFRLPSEELEQRFIAEGAAQGLYYLKGHRAVGGIRASIYNAMPLEGAQALAQFMDHFAAQNG